ncbi:hypothetical protein ACH5RR_004751 [Cinchona calisaya]|uniref:FZ domain-containing protein n=1 Tax=Cinchona calisaya TaxID=153742 RepID=A0ABD3AYF3_9GENT
MIVEGILPLPMVLYCNWRSLKRSANYQFHFCGSVIDEQGMYPPTECLADLKMVPQNSSDASALCSFLQFDASDLQGCNKLLVTSLVLKPCTEACLSYFVELEPNSSNLHKKLSPSLLFFFPISFCQLLQQTFVFPFTFSPLIFSRLLSDLSNQPTPRMGVHHAENP